MAGVLPAVGEKRREVVGVELRANDPPGPENEPGRMSDMTRDAWRFVADTQALRGAQSGRDAAWIAEAVQVLNAANHIDLGVDSVRTAIEAAVFLSGGGWSDGVVKGGD